MNEIVHNEECYQTGNGLSGCLVVGGKRLIMLVGPPGAGKSTMALKFATEGFTYINQDSQGREHLALFDDAILAKENIVVDRMNFTKHQRSHYLDFAKLHGYQTKVIVLHQPHIVCLERCLARQGHETIKDEKNALGALNMFFSKYERVEDWEADVVERIWPEDKKTMAIWSDLDGTLCEVGHRLHFVRRPDDQRKDWNGFFGAMIHDTANRSVMKTLELFSERYPIVYCTGRPDDYRKVTLEWLRKEGAPDGLLFMRSRTDRRPDNITKEIMLDFEVLTRYDVLFCLDDRDSVVKMLRDRGLTVFQVAKGDF
jgi:adenylate kinase family enzyme